MKSIYHTARIVSRGTYSPRQLCSRLGISMSMLYRQISSNKLPFRVLRIGARTMFSVNEIEKWINGTLEVEQIIPTKRRGRPRKTQLNNSIRRNKTKFRQALNH